MVKYQLIPNMYDAVTSFVKKLTLFKNHLQRKMNSIKVIMMSKRYKKNFPIFWRRFQMLPLRYNWK